MNAVVAEFLPQGPLRHCHNLVAHPKHANPNNEEPTAWCCGTVPLTEFVELTFRLPVSEYFGEDIPVSNHAEMMAEFAAENPNIMGWLWGIHDGAVVVRIRALGEDVVYNLPDGRWPDGERGE